MLLDVDGLSEGWKNGVPSPWEMDQVALTRGTFQNAFVS
jgi:hypothetical protein